MTTANVLSIITAALAANDMPCTQIANGEVVFPLETIDGVQVYGSVKVGKKQAKDTKRNAAFNLDDAVAAYADKQAETAKKSASKGVKAPKELDPATVALMNDIKGMLDHDTPYTAQELAQMFDEENRPSWQKVSAILKAFEREGVVAKVDITEGDNKGKKGYTLA